MTDDSLWESRPYHCHLPCHKHVVQTGRHQVCVLLYRSEWQIGRRGCTYAAFIVLEVGSYKQESIFLMPTDICRPHSYERRVDEGHCKEGLLHQVLGTRNQESEGKNGVPSGGGGPCFSLQRWENVDDVGRDFIFKYLCNLIMLCTWHVSHLSVNTLAWCAGFLPSVLR
ncbi:hypothetical protein LINGRAHAP2_LOCUS4857 [Linum grandiflorum]